MKYCAGRPVFFLMLIVVSLLSQGCCSSVSPSQFKAKVEAAKASTRPAGMGSYFYVMPQAQRDRFAAAVTKIPLGTNDKEVIHELGPPDNDADGDAGQFFARKHRCRELTYYVVMVNEGVVDLNADQQVTLYFDWSGRLEMVSSQCTGIPSRQTNDVYDDSVAPNWWNPFACRRR
jgi:hypothetical protein